MDGYLFYNNIKNVSLRKVISLINNNKRLLRFCIIRADIEA